MNLATIYHELKGSAMTPVVFDLDGTLVDSVPDIHACATLTLQEFDAEPLGVDRIRSFVGGGVGMLWDRIIAATTLDPARHDDFVAAFMRHYQQATAHSTLYPGVLECLRDLQAAGHPIGLCTNKPLVPTRKVLDHFGIAPFMGVVIAGDTQPERKPHPAPLTAAFAALGGQGIFVGDSEFDADCAAALSVPFLLFTEGYRNTPLDQMRHAASFGDHADLPGLVRQADAMVRA
ncbi:phosphoglycolate phosphatase [Paracoccus zeaxanthinifaciens]|uniref:phosphoglycolate phosphatase n=1 Tax=Paracoccus zeaxanthinifaciens TaxID=187400 RepID=UPI00040263B7|nr:phosphoglycolate phosphatase [Paracoccus zeaxanthinifaciens]